MKNNKDLKLFNVKFKINEDNQLYSEIRIYKNNKLDVLVFLRDELKVSDEIIDSIDEIENFQDLIELEKEAWNEED